MNLTINDVVVKSAPNSSDFIPLWDVETQQQKKASVDSLVNPGSIPHFGFRTGVWYLPHYLNDITATTATLAANTVVIEPFLVPVKTNFITIGINITTAAGASGTARLGVYELLPNFSLGKILAQGEVLTNTINFKSVAISLTKPLQGWYALVVNVNANCVVTAYPNSQRGFVFGCSSPPSSYVSYVTAALTYANGPYIDSPTLTLANSITNAVPAIWMQSV